MALWFSVYAAAFAASGWGLSFHAANVQHPRPYAKHRCVVVVRWLLHHVHVSFVIEVFCFWCRSGESVGQVSCCQWVRVLLYSISIIRWWCGFSLGLRKLQCCNVNLKGLCTFCEEEKKNFFFFFFSKVLCIVSTLASLHVASERKEIGQFPASVTVGQVTWESY